jgi:hypothetical protein
MDNSSMISAGACNPLPVAIKFIQMEHAGFRIPNHFKWHGNHTELFCSILNDRREIGVMAPVAPI